MSTKIYDFISTYRYKERDKNVLNLINEYYRNNVEAISDGLVNTSIAFGDESRNKFYDGYRVNELEYKAFHKKNKNLIKNEAANDFLYLLLFTSFCDTGDVAFLDMLGLIEIGSKYKKYFKYGVTNPNKMMYVIENMDTRSSVKKYGSIFLTVQNQNREMLKSGQLRNRFKNAKTDENYNYIINRISTNINLTMRRISNRFYSTKDDVIYTESENVGGEDDKIYLANNSVVINNILYMCDNYHPTSLDSDILKIIKIDTPIKKQLLKFLLIDKIDSKYFYRVSKIFVDYYAENISTDVNQMKKDFVVKSVNARPNSIELRNLENELYKDINKWIKDFKKTTTDKKMENIHHKSEMVIFVRKLKQYCIIKTRSFIAKV